MNCFNITELSRLSGNVLLCKDEILQDWDESSRSVIEPYSDKKKHVFDITLLQKTYQDIVNSRGYLYEICKEIRSGGPVIPEFLYLVGAYVDFYNFWDDKYSMLNHVDWKMLYSPIKETLEAISSFLPDKDWGDIHCDIFERAKAAEAVGVQQKSNPEISLKVEHFKNNLIQAPEYRVAINRGLITEPFIWNGESLEALATWLTENHFIRKGAKGWCWSMADNVFTFDGRLVSKTQLGKAGQRSGL